MSKLLYYFGLGAVFITGSYFLYDEWQKNSNDKARVRNAPIIEAYTSRSPWAICKDEGVTENLTVICVDQFKKDNGKNSLNNIRPDVKFKFRDINRDSQLGKKPDLVRIISKIN